MAEDTPSDKRDLHNPAAQNVTQLTAARRRKSQKNKRKARAQGNTLCTRGFHKWALNKTNPFDTKSGKLVSAERCTRCGVTRTKLT